MRVTAIAYGKKCYVSPDDPLRRADSILKEAGRGIVRIQGDSGYDRGGKESNADL